MPAFALEDFVQRSARSGRWRHGVQHPRVGFFLQRALSQEFLHILFAGQGALGLIMKLRFLPLFCRFHAANGDLGSGNIVPPAIEPARNRVSEYRRLCAEVSKFFLPTLCVALFRFSHPQENAFAFLVVLALRQVAIGLRGLDFRLPVARDHVDCFVSIRSTAAQDRFFWITRRIFTAHKCSISGL